MENKVKVFSKNDIELSEKEKDLIDNYIDKYNEEDFEKNFSNEIKPSELLYLSSQSKNLLNWYPSINKNDDILQIGGNLGELTSTLCDKSKYVVTIEPNYEKGMAISKRLNNYENFQVLIGDFKTIDNSEQNVISEKQFDYIILVGIFERIEEIFGDNLKLEDVIKILEKYLKNKGKFLFATDNKFGLRYFVGNSDSIYNKKFVSLLGYNNEEKRIETFTKKKIEKILDSLGYKYKFYYPLPDYRIPNVIFSDNYLPNYKNIDKYYPYSNDNSDILINEIDLYREILKDNVEEFPFFANSFFVEFTKGEIDNTYKYISFNNLRKAKYRLITKIAENYVEKQPVNFESKAHYEIIKENIKLLESKNIQTLDYIENDIVKSKFTNHKYMFENIIVDELENGNYEKFYIKLKQYVNIIKKDFQKIKNYNETIFYKYGFEQEEVPFFDELHYLKDGLWDMTFNNCFYYNNDFYFYDQEWKETNIPMEYILYRTILYTISLRRYINIQELIKELKLDNFVDIFYRLDCKIQEEIRDEKLWTFFNRNLFFDIDATKQEMINMGIRSDAKDGAINNYRNEIEVINQKIKELELEKNRLNIELDKTLKRKIRKILGGSNEQKN